MKKILLISVLGLVGCGEQFGVAGDVGGGGGDDSETGGKAESGGSMNSTGGNGSGGEVVGSGGVGSGVGGTGGSVACPDEDTFLSDGHYYNAKNMAYVQEQYSLSDYADVVQNGDCTDQALVCKLQNGLVPKQYFCGSDSTEENTMLFTCPNFDPSYELSRSKPQYLWNLEEQTLKDYSFQEPAIMFTTGIYCYRKN